MTHKVYLQANMLNQRFMGVLHSVSDALACENELNYIVYCVYNISIK